ncbi:ABC transporter substrate-binding protein [Jiangella asiatica]|uniref:ABC transporter substrate-binding protein n=2 Tax=Jiangella asiatica TaxID=2530372 RepID=A0A4R5CTQ0_9ACTN|nr:ABC transporter substrate-binding protein [Jiangella asiatica]
MRFDGKELSVMRKFVRRSAPLAGIVATVVLVAAGCVSDPTSSDDSGGDATSALNVYLYQKPTPNFGPLAQVAGGDYVPSTLIFDSLVAWDADNKLAPRLAEDFSISDDGKTFTFTLREGLEWSDGEPLTSRDILFTFNLVANPAAGASVAPNFAAVEGVDALASGSSEVASGFSAPDDRTFVVTASEPSMGLLSLIGTTLIIPEHVLGDIPVEQVADDGYFSSPTVSSGPYEYVSYETDQYVELTANPHYYEDVSVDTLYLRTLTQDVATAQLGSGEIDLVQISSTDLASVERMENVAVTSAEDPGFTRLAVNVEQPRFQDPRVRQAMLYAIDRQGIVDTVLGGHGTVVNSPFKGEAVADDLNPYPYDPDLARQLLQEAGWDSSRPVTLSYAPGTRDRDTTATIVQENLSAVGIDVRLSPVPPAENLARIQSADPDDFDMTLYGGGNYSDPANVIPIVSCATKQPAGANNGRFCSEELDAVMAEANRLEDESGRTALYQEASRIENEQVSQIWLYETEILWAHNTRFEGFVPGGDLSRSSMWNAAQWRMAD